MATTRTVTTIILLAGLGWASASPLLAQRRPVTTLIQTRDRDLAAIRARATQAIAGLPHSGLTAAAINRRLAPLHTALLAWGSKYSVPIRRRTAVMVPLNTPNAAKVTIKIPRSAAGPIVSCPHIAVAGVDCIIIGVSGTGSELSCTYDCPDPPEK